MVFLNFGSNNRFIRHGTAMKEKQRKMRQRMAARTQLEMFVQISVASLPHLRRRVQVQWLEMITGAISPQARGGDRSKHPHLLALKVSAHVGDEFHRHMLMANAMGVARNSGNHVVRVEASSRTVYFRFESVEARWHIERTLKNAKKGYSISRCSTCLYKSEQLAGQEKSEIDTRPKRRAVVKRVVDKLGAEPLPEPKTKCARKDRVLQHRIHV